MKVPEVKISACRLITKLTVAELAILLLD